MLQPPGLVLDAEIPEAFEVNTLIDHRFFQRKVKLCGVFI